MKFKAFADDTSNLAKMMISVSYRVESIVGKGENAGYQYFLLFPQYFQTASSAGSLEVRTVWQRVKELGTALNNFVMYPCTIPRNNHLPGGIALMGDNK